jgi:hypothetical protein
MIDAAFKIPVNSVAQIISSDIMGNRSIKMILSKETELYQTNDTIPGAIESDLKEQVSLQVLPIKNKAEQLLSTIDSAITVLTVIFNEDARKNLSESFENINQTSCRRSASSTTISPTHSSACRGRSPPSPIDSATFVPTPSASFRTCRTGASPPTAGINGARNNAPAFAREPHAVVTAVANRSIDDAQRTHAPRRRHRDSQYERMPGWIDPHGGRRHQSRGGVNRCGLQRAAARRAGAFLVQGKVAAAAAPREQAFASTPGCHAASATNAKHSRDTPPAL